MAPAFEFQATLEDSSIAEMFWTISRHKVPGRIEIQRDDVVKRIYIQDGTVIHATSTDRTDRLGAQLYRAGTLSREELVATMREREASDKRHGQLLVESGLLSPAELLAAVHAQIESIVWSVFSWQQGEVRFVIGVQAQAPFIRIHLPVRQMILRGVQRIADTKSMMHRMGARSTLYRPTFDTEDLIQIALKADEYKLLTLVDGRRSLYELCTQGPLGAAENARLLYAFRILQLIERTDDTGGVKLRLPVDRTATG